jgi:Putative Actinobacterial Holin-X, holin superfamily III
MSEWREAAGSEFRTAERPIGRLLSDLARQSALLLRQEVALAKAEIFGKLSQLGTGAGLVAAGGILALCGFIYLLAAATLALALVVDPWLAALIVGLLALIAGGVLAWVGRTRFQADNLVPRRSLRSLRDDAEWAKEQMR